jgi:DNA-binding LytR/AlgR family response regulator
MTTALIADDEPMLRQVLKNALTDLWPELEIIAECGDGAESLRMIEARHPDVCFLDIRMPKLSGLDLAERVQGSSQIVFVTAYDEHAVTAFEQGAVDYLLKPIRRGRLAATIQRLQGRLGDGAREAARKPFLKRIQANVGNTLRFFSVEDIHYCHSDGKYTRIVTGHADALIRRSLTALLEHLDPDRFWRIHRGTVINIDCVDRVVRNADGDMKVLLKGNGVELAVSKPQQSLFRGM